MVEVMKVEFEKMEFEKMMPLAVGFFIVVVAMVVACQRLCSRVV